MSQAGLHVWRPGSITGFLLAALSSLHGDCDYRQSHPSLGTDLATPNEPETVATKAWASRAPWPTRACSMNAQEPLPELPAPQLRCTGNADPSQFRLSIADVGGSARVSARTAAEQHLLHCYPSVVAQRGCRKGCRLTVGALLWP